MLVSRGNLNEILSKIAGSTFISIDTETTGLRFFNGDSAFSCIVYDGVSSYYFNFIPYPGLGEEFVLSRSQLKSVGEAIDGAATIAFANAKFDMHMLSEYIDFSDRKIFDVLLADKIINNMHQSYSLENVAKRYGFEKSKEVENYITKNKIYENKNPRFDKVPLHIIQPYAEQDAKITYDIAKHQIKNMLSYHKFGYSTKSQLMKLEMEVLKVCFKMEQVGIKIDTNYVKKAIEYEQSNISSSKTSFSEHTGAELIDSNKHREMVFSSIGVSGGRTAKGNPSYKSSALGAIQHPGARDIESYRDSNKRVSSYFSNFIRYSDDNNTIHCQIKQAAAHTFRFSITDPALQTLNSEDTSSFPVRDAFVARDEFILVAIDYAQQEYRLTADYSGETSLIKKIMAGEDVHEATAKLMGVDRKTAKTLNFMLLYGGGVLKLAASLGVSETKARALKSKYFSALPKIKQLINKASSMAESTGIIVNFAGAGLHFPEKDKSYKATNYLIQSSGAFIMRYALVHLQSFLNGYRSRMLLTIHDEILFEIHHSELHIIPELRDIMVRVYTPRNGCYMDTSVSWGYRWGSLKEEDPSEPKTRDIISEEIRRRAKEVNPN